MGYYSNFEVIDANIVEVVDFLNDLLFNTGAPGWTEYDGVVTSYDSTKWYDWIEDLQDIAEQHPNLYLVIERTGEESPDISRAVVRNGTTTEIRPEIVWPEY